MISLSDLSLFFRELTPVEVARLVLLMPLWPVPQYLQQAAGHPNQVTSWKAPLEGGAANVFGPGSGVGTAPPAVDVKSLHAKIGELTLENDFLEGALTKAGLLSARR